MRVHPHLHLHLPTLRGQPMKISLLKSEPISTQARVTYPTTPTHQRQARIILLLPIGGYMTKRLQMNFWFITWNTRVSACPPAMPTSHKRFTTWRILPDAPRLP